MNTEDRLRAVREESVGGWVRRVKLLNEEKERKPHGHRQLCGDYKRG